jgi:tRNA(Ile)-lysidine synthase
MAEQPTSADPFVAAVAAFIDGQRLLRPCATVVVAVSGGRDSVALLAALRELSGQPERSYRLTVAHLDHALREGAGDDAAFVRALAEQWNLPVVVSRRDVGAEARRRGQGVEEAARAVRYAFLGEVARSVGATFVATGAHADDNVETILHRVVRGTHLRGLAGMCASRPLEGGQVILVRPLLGSRRDDITAYCRRAKLPWRSDPTNADTGLRRNFIRHELLPLLRARLNPQVDAALLRLAAAAGEAETHLSAEASAAVHRALREMGRHHAVLSEASLAGEDAAVRSRAFRAVLEEVGVPMRSVDAQHFARLVDLAGGSDVRAVPLPGGFEAKRERGRIIVQRPPTETGFEAVALTCPGRTDLPDGSAIVCELAALDARQGNRRPNGWEVLDADTIRGSLVCRPRRPGDAFVPLGAPGRQSVGDFLTNRKVPGRRRRQVRCLCDEEGIVYVAPLRIADRVKVTETTRRLLRIAIIPAGGS